MGSEVIEKLCASLSLKDREGPVRKLQNELKTSFGVDGTRLESTGEGLDWSVGGGSGSDPVLVGKKSEGLSSREGDIPGVDHKPGDDKVVRPDPMLVGQSSTAQEVGFKQKLCTGPFSDGLELVGTPNWPGPDVESVSVVLSEVADAMKSVDVSSLGLSKVLAGPETGESSKKEMGGGSGFSTKKWKRAARAGPVRQSDVGVLSSDVKRLSVGRLSSAHQA
ncbi:hypothetical protein Q3G72_000877 [Acer saccharum]|nr:hypothetical protein Q3G72_000877 [Acer saccharum]